ncbi:MAG: hypothetical protein WBZ22_16565, partial [Pseudolabrys sp.]
RQYSLPEAPVSSIDLLPKSIRNALPTLHIPTVGIAIMSVVVIVILRHLRPNWPSFLIVVSVAAIVCAVFPIDFATVHSRFGTVQYRAGHQSRRHDQRRVFLRCYCASPGRA